ncbi:MBG domain-containing protein [Flavobacterium branchiicola]|uniref:MBG domain-containing protein n=1 Tax=Flavobacterium branchiicola TaxID=1114875 RepID=A0ABV9PHP9_9FLAO|nr:MBG domain-containing protein [Flavobacterium branchiicola]MBS7255790.1 T9SS type A sorting domain-containing protein [Flavobacterium branchiicola]
MKHFYSQIKNFINIALFLGIFLQSFSGYSQTLTVGDIIFTGYDSTFNATDGDAYSFVCLVPIPASTTISFTDRGYFETGTWQAVSTLEGTVSWTSGATVIPTGTEIIIQGKKAYIYNLAGGTTTENGVVTQTEGTMTNGLVLSGTGDQIVAFQGGSGVVTGAGVTFISGLHFFRCAQGTTQSGWDDPLCANGSNGSVMPPNLVGGTSAFYTEGTTPASAKFNSASGVPITTVAQIRTAVMNPANWTLSATSLPLPSAATFLGTPPTITGNPPNRTICPGNNTTFSITANNATGYQWQVNQGSGFNNISNGVPYSGALTATLTLTGVTAAMSGYLYRCVATGVGSVNSNNATLTVPNTIVTTTAQTNVSCNGGTNGSATISATGGITPYTYSWSPSGGTGATASNLAANTYTVTVTDNIGCMTSHTVIIAQPTIAQSSPAITTHPASFSACAGTNTSITVAATNVATYQWQVNNGLGFANISDGGTSPNYAGATTATLAIDNITAGMDGLTYRVILKSSCLFTTTSNSATLTFTPPTLIVTNPDASTICSGSNTTFSVTAANATGYQWQVDQGGGFNNISNGAPYSGATTSTLTITNATVGLSGYLYRVIATGTCAPATSNNAALTVNPAPSISIPPSPSTICAGANTTFSVTASNATGYQWQVDQGGGFTNISNGAPYSGENTATLTITGATAGLSGSVYRVVATGGCTPAAVSNSAALTVNSSPSISTQPSASSICTGANTTFFVSAANATGYQWQVDNGSGFTSISNNATYSGATTATLTITGATVGLNGYRYRAIASGVCTPAAPSNDALLTVGFTPAITAEPSSITVCIGENTTFTAAASNATSLQWEVNNGSGFTNVNNAAPYSGATTSSLTITGAIASLNNYQYRLIAIGGCPPNATSLAATLKVPTILANPTQTNVNCNGGDNGTATVAPSGGTAPYTFLWSNNQTNATITGLIAGSYSVIIEDANHCQITQNFTITQLPLLVASQGTITNVSCYNGTNGTAAVNVTGGAGGYTYSWAPTGGSAATATGLASGTYTVTVTDANLCQTTQSFVVGQPNAPLSATTSQDDILCNGYATGSASVVVSGGTLGYTYFWAPSGGTAATASNLTAGVYTVTITDANSCQINKTFTITEPAIALTVTPVSQTNIACFGEATGSATVSASGGTGAYSYSWAPSGGTGATASGLISGTYVVTVTDDNGCQQTQTFTIGQPAAPLSATTASTGISCNGGSNGTASVTVSGGTPGYTYAWAPLGGIASSVSGRPAGDYTCTITDANGCSIVKNITIGTPAPFSASVSTSDVSCNGGANGTATITPSGATFPYSYTWTPYGGSAATASGLAAGDYSVLVEDANGCVYSVDVHINQPAILDATISKTDVLCNGGATGTATVTPSGGNSSYTYSWAPYGGTDATATGLSVGVFDCTITDAKGCFITRSITINQPAVLTATTSQIDATCSTSGQAGVTPSGGTTPYSYSWSPSGETTDIATNLAAGNHSVVITDANGCTLTKNFVIITNNTLVATIGQSDVLCHGANTGSASVVPSGAPGPFTYVWAPSGGNNDTASNLTAGNYSVTITSSNGCTIVKNVTITEPSAITLVPSQVDILCHGEATGQASITATGGTGAYTYSWAPSGATGATATGLAAGTHTVTVKDANGCTAIQNFTIVQPNAIIATVSKSDVTCIGSNNGSVSLSVTGGTGAYTYSWSSSPGTGSSISGLSAGTYAVTITDANSCSITENIIITQPDNLVNLSTLTPTSVTVSSAVLTGTVFSDGINRDNGSCLAEAGFVFATHSNPSVTDTKVTIGSALGSLSSPLSNLKGNTTYYVKTYAINSNGNVNYGNEISFTTEKYKLTITATAGHKKVYGTADPVFDYTAAGFVNGDTSAIISGSLSREAGEDVGTYNITAGTISAGADYTIVLESATFEIIKADQVITWSQTLEFGCDTGEEAQLTASSNSGLPINYSIASSNIGEISGTTLHIKNSGSTTITAAQNGNLNYNPATAVTKPVTVSQSGLVIQQWSDVLLFNNQSKIFVAFQWYKNGAAVAGATRQYYSEGQPLNGTYYVIAKDIKGNSIKSCPLVLTGAVFTNTLKVYPNPVKASNEFTLECNFSESQLSGATVTIFNITGTLVQTISNVKAKNQITAPSQSGVYIIMLTLSSGQLKTINLLVN